MRFCLIFKKRGYGTLAAGIETSWRSAVLVVTPTVCVTFSSWKWHLWHSLSECNIFTSVGSSSPSPEQTAAIKAVCTKCPHTVNNLVQAGCMILSPRMEWKTSDTVLMLYLRRLLYGLFFVFYLTFIYNIHKVFPHHHICVAFPPVFYCEAPR